MERPIMNILALDVASKTGWAHSDGVSGVWVIKARRGKAELISAPYGRLYHKLSELHYNRPIDVVAVEDAHVRFVTAAKLLFEFRGVVRVWCERKGIKFVGDISPKTIKKHASGNGNASKKQMLLLANCNNPSIYIHDDNEADALHLLDYCQKTFSKN